jgi:hypothetical protein
MRPDGTLSWGHGGSCVCLGRRAVYVVEREANIDLDFRAALLYPNVAEAV